MKLSTVLSMFLVVASALYAAEPAAEASAGDDAGLPQAGPAEAGQESRGTLEVQPGRPAIRTTEIHRPVSPLKSLPRNILSDQRHIWTSPFHTSAKDAKWWLIFGSAATGLVASDRWTSKQLPNTKDQIRISKWTSRMGASYTLLPLTAGIYTFGTFSRNERLRETGLLGFEALANTFIDVTLLKAVTDRERPLEGNGKGRFLKSQGSVLSASFPSGHAIHSWALASVVAHQYPRPRIIPILAYSFATVVAGSRFAARKHFASDVVVGGALGWFIGDFVWARRHNRQLDGGKTSNLEKVLAHVNLGM